MIILYYIVYDRVKALSITRVTDDDDDQPQPVSDVP